MYDCIVIGGGIIGTTVAKTLLDKGLSCALFDRGDYLAGTAPSGGHLKPGWFGDMPKSEYEPSIELLDDCWGIVNESFRCGPARIPLMRVDTDKVLKYPKIQKAVHAIKGQATKTPEVILSDESYKCRLLVLATGVWANELLKDQEYDIQRKRGISFLVPGQLKHPFVKPWAPYKQIVAHQQTNSKIWVGDGSAILDKNWDEKRIEQCRKRCLKSLKKPLKTNIRQREGLRAYVKHSKKHPCVFDKVGRNIYLATGAGKSGTISAGWVTRKILELF
jgi:glycine/D-amino acid oxidase-like deaminating enzyme